MKAERERQTPGTIPFLIMICLVALPAQAKYGGGTGTPDDPYQIWTPEQMNAIGTEPNDWSKHFKLMVDIDLSDFDGGEGQLESGIIGTSNLPFTGVFDGGGNTISNLRRVSAEREGVALFGYVGRGGRIQNLREENAEVAAWMANAAGSVAGRNLGTISNCHAQGRVIGATSMGGLVGWNQGVIVDCSSATTVLGGASEAGGLVGWNEGEVINCHAAGDVSGGVYTGGLVGRNRQEGITVHCYATGDVSASAGFVGGLVGWNSGTTSSCYSTGNVRGGIYPTGGLVGYNVGGTIESCYSTSLVSGRSSVGGLIGTLAHGRAVVADCYSTGAVTGNDHVGGLVGENEDSVVVRGSFWDVETSGQLTSAGGSGKSTSELKDMRTYLNAGWDFAFADEGTSDIWAMPTKSDYPILWWQLPESELPSLPAFSGGSGTPADPYLVSTPAELNTIGRSPRLVNKHFLLVRDMNAVGESLRMIGSPARPFTGHFDGDGRTIRNVSLETDVAAYLGLFGYVAQEGRIENLMIRNIDVNAPPANYVGGLSGWNSGTVAGCRVTGNISGDTYVGGLVGRNWGGTIAESSFSGSVRGNTYIGGLAGSNRGTIRSSCSAGSATGRAAGGVAGSNIDALIANCYSTCSVSGDQLIGGLVAYNTMQGTLVNCYSRGSVVATGSFVGGLLGENFGGGAVTASFWDVQNSRQATSGGGVGKTTAEMQTAQTFLDAGWDFVGETANGTDDIWWIDEGKDYPRLWWEAQD